MIFYYCSTGGYGWQGGILRDKKAPIRRVGAYERLSAAGGISLASTHFIRAQRGNKDSDLRAGARLFLCLG